MRSLTAIGDAALLGAAGGLRAAMPWAALALRGRVGGGARRWAPPAAAVELVLDKLPRTPSRTAPPGLAGRLVGGALVGGMLGGGSGAAIACAMGGASAFAGERTRAALGRRTGLPDPLLAVAEDAVAVTLALAATRRLA